MQLNVFNFSIQENIAHIRLNQPDIGNPFNTAFCSEFNELSIECGENKEIGAVIIDAAGPNFSVGGDLKKFLAATDEMSRNFKRMTADLHMGVVRFARIDAPVIVAAHNLVVGGAVALVTAADFAFATPETRFYAAFAAVALCGDTGITHFLPRRVGSRRAEEFLMLNETWSADKAADTGLINGIVAETDMEDHCRTLAKKLAAGPTEVFGRLRRLLLTTYNQSIETQLEMEARGMTECARSAEAWRAMQKLMKK